MSFCNNSLKNNSETIQLPASSISYSGFIKLNSDSIYQTVRSGQFFFVVVKCDPLKAPDQEDRWKRYILNHSTVWFLWRGCEGKVCLRQSLGGKWLVIQHKMSPQMTPNKAKISLNAFACAWLVITKCHYKWEKMSWDFCWILLLCLDDESCNVTRNGGK